MSLNELKHSVEGLTPDERFELAAFLQHLAQKEDPGHRRALDEANARIAVGKKISLDELRKMVAVMDAKEL